MKTFGTEIRELFEKRMLHKTVQLEGLDDLVDRADSMERRVAECDPDYGIALRCKIAEHEVTIAKTRASNEKLKVNYLHLQDELSAAREENDELRDELDRGSFPKNILRFVEYIREFEW